MASDREERLKEFWFQLLSNAKKSGFMLHDGISATTENRLKAPKNRIEWNYIIAKDCGRVQLYLGLLRETEREQVFRELLEHRETIEKELTGVEWEWGRTREIDAPRVNFWPDDATSFSKPATWPAMQAAMIQAMRRFHLLLSRYIKR